MSDWLREFGRLPEVVFAAPERLWFGLPVLAVLLLAPLARRRRPAPWPTLLRALALVSLLAVLLDPVVPERETTTGRLLVLADVSPSVGPDGIAAARRFLAEAPVPYELVAAGATPADATLATLAPDPREATDLAAALRLAAVRAPAGAPLRVLLFSDGRATVPGAEEAARRLRRGGAEVLAVPVPAKGRTRRPDLRAVRLEAPARDRRREPFPLTVHAHATAATDAEVTLFLDGVAERTRVVLLPAGAGAFALEPLALAPGRYYAQVVLAGDDSPFDNEAALVLEVPGVPRVLCLAREKRRALFAEALAKQGLEVDVAAAAAAHDFARYDAVLLLPDAPVADLEKHAGSLAEFVGQRGGGLIAVGGAGGEGLARLHGTPLSFLLPLEVEPRPPPEPETPPRPEPEEKPEIEIVEEEKEAYPISLCLVLDTSGSMAQFGKIERAKAAAAAAAIALTPEDRVAVVTFGDTVEVVVPPRPAGDPRAVLAALRPLRAEGKTAMFQALQTAFGVLRTEESPIRHLVLLTDGVSSDFGPWRDLATKMAAEKITISSVGVGWDIDRRLLSQLAVWGRGRYWSANHAHEIPQVVTQDTLRVVKARDRRGEDAERARERDEPEEPQEPEPPPAQPPEPEPEPPAPDAVPMVPQPAAPREMLKGIPDEELPKVHGFEEGKPRFASWVAATAGTDGPPLLAYWRVGLGTAAALTVDPETPGELRDHRELPRLLAQLVRSVLPDAGRAPLVLEQGRVRAGSDEKLWIRAIAEDGLPRTDLALALTVGGTPVPVRRGADRYEAVLPDRDAPTAARIAIGPADAPVLARGFVLPPSVSAELARTGPDRAALSRLVGHPDRLDPAPAAALRLPEAIREHSRPLRLPFLLFAAILLPFDAWARRRARSASR